MSRLVKALVLSLCLAAAVSASLRVRYTNFSRHYYKVVVDSGKAAHINASMPSISGDSATFGTGGSEESSGEYVVLGKDSTSVAPFVAIGDTILQRGFSGSNEKNDREWKNALDCGAWDAYDAQNGFDNSDSLGSSCVPEISAENETFVDAKWWIDSLGEDKWRVAPYIYPNVLDTTLSLGGYMAMAFGQLTVTEAGEYIIATTGRYEGTKVWIDVNGDGTFSDSLDESNWQSKAAGSLDSVPLEFQSKDFSATHGPSSRTKLRAWKVSLAAGKYKIRSHYWAWGSEPSYSVVAWVKPGKDTAEVIPASAFGARKQYGAPAAVISGMKLKGVEMTANDTAHICLPETLTLEGTLQNAPAGAGTITYLWRLSSKDTIISTTTNTIQYALDKTGSFRPELRITFGGEFPTRFSGATYQVRVMGCEPIAKIESISKSGIAIAAHDTVCDTSLVEYTFIASASNIIDPSAAVTYTWDLGDTTITTASDTVKYAFAKFGKKRPKLTVTAGTSSSSSVTFTYSLVISDCGLVGVKTIQGLRPEMLTVSGSKVLVKKNNSDPIRVMLFSLDGRKAFSADIISNGALKTIDFASSSVPRGMYVVRMMHQGTWQKASRVLIP